MAQHAILRFEKHKGNPARPLEAHHERQKEQYASNPDIDTSPVSYTHLDVYKRQIQRYPLKIYVVFRVSQTPAIT